MSWGRIFKNPYFSVLHEGQKKTKKRKLVTYKMTKVQ